MDARVPRSSYLLWNLLSVLFWCGRNAKVVSGSRELNLIRFCWAFGYCRNVTPPWAGGFRLSAVGHRFPASVYRLPAFRFSGWLSPPSRNQKAEANWTLCPPPLTDFSNFCIHFPNHRIDHPPICRPSAFDWLRFLGCNSARSMGNVEVRRSCVAPRRET